jgi:arylsulfatase
MTGSTEVISWQAVIFRLESTIREFIRNRARILKSVDEGVGQLRSALERTGQLDNTVFVFTSDEGPRGSPKSGYRGSLQNRP